MCTPRNLGNIKAGFMGSARKWFLSHYNCSEKLWGTKKSAISASYLIFKINVSLVETFYVSCKNNKTEVTRGSTWIGDEMTNSWRPCEMTVPLLALVHQCTLLKERESNETYRGAVATRATEDNYLGWQTISLNAGTHRGLHIITNRKYASRAAYLHDERL
jgi:hypothetical protein